METYSWLHIKPLRNLEEDGRTETETGGFYFGALEDEPRERGSDLTQAGVSLRAAAHAPVYHALKGGRAGPV